MPSPRDDRTDGNVPGSGGNTPADDEALLSEVRTAAAQHDSLPQPLRAYLGELLSWRDAEAELAVLVADSRDLADAVRGGDYEVLLRFESSPRAITFSVTPDGRGKYRLIGEIAPATSGEVRVANAVAPNSDMSVRCDEGGRFEVYPVSGGPVCLRFSPDDGQPVRTAWIVLSHHDP